jgi:hypothetical protein
MAITANKCVLQIAAATCSAENSLFQQHPNLGN